jgi:twitching motility protein PilT
LHIVSIEDPIEYVHHNQMSVITQREVGTDTRSFQEALRRVLRQDPDAIIIGEARDAETMRTALTAAETGHLVFTTLHTVTARETINRVLEMFPHEEQNQVRHTLAGILRAVVCQRMAPRDDTDGKTVVQEILFRSGRIEDAIVDPEKGTMIDEIIAESKDGYGMQTFNQAFCDLVGAGKLSVETAMRMSNNPQDLRQMLHRETGTDPLADPETPAGSRIQLD